VVARGPRGSSFGARLVLRDRLAVRNALLITRLTAALLGGRMRSHCGRHVSELERLQLQSRVWEPSGRRLLEELGDGRSARALDMGCGALGWLRILSEWVGPTLLQCWGQTPA
jgi:hypothetical protein